MKNPLSLVVFAAICSVCLTSCIEPLPPAPPPYFRPNPPYPPQPVDPYASPSDYDSPQDEARNYSTAPPPEPTRPGEYPTARATEKQDEVISPFEPYNTINVEGYKSGQLVRDPHNKQIFRVP